MLDQWNVVSELVEKRQKELDAAEDLVGFCYR